MKDQETKEKITHLEKILGKINQKKKLKETDNPTFKTNEVLILLFITLIISLIIGGLLTYRLTNKQVKKVDSNLQELINNYNYIVKNYNGQITEKELTEAAIEGMVSKLDKNSVYFNSDYSENLDMLLEGAYNGIGILVYNENENIIVYNVFKDSPADKAGLQIGDVITKINGKSVRGLSSSEISDKIKKIKTDKFNITYIRNGIENTIEIAKGKVSFESVRSTVFNQQSQKIGYIGVSIFAQNTFNQFQTKLNQLEKENINALIIDVRGNSGGYLYAAESILSMFLDAKHPIYQIEKAGKAKKHYSSGTIDKKYKIAVLVDKNSASASEVLASALKEQLNATLIGTKTYGKGTVQEVQNLKSGEKYKLTTKNWLTSKGKWIDGKGLDPDVLVELNESYFENPSEENDNQLKAAINNLTNN